MKMVFWYIINDRYNYFSLPMSMNKTFLEGKIKPEMIGENLLKKTFEEFGFKGYCDFTLSDSAFLEKYDTIKSRIEILCESKEERRVV